MSEKIKYYSTNRKSKIVDFREALLKGLAPDGGLYMPDRIPVMNNGFLANMTNMEYYMIANEILKSFLNNEIDDDNIKNICREAYNFDVPLEKVYGRKYILRLDQGPTASFKDFAARLMARLIHFYVKRDNMKLTILTATSGDTGSAVASAFHGLSGIDVIILFPINEVSEMQRKQMTTLQKNITVIGINGKFDDCQKMAKFAFGDEGLKNIPLTSANSINIGRLIPQSVYYMYAWSRLREHIDEQVIFSVPSGNFGNLMGGILARQMGMPVKKFIISTNSNDEVPKYLTNGIYEPIEPSLNCISNAMNVGHPSNFARIFEIYGGIMDPKGGIIKDPDLDAMNNDFFGASVNDDETRSTIKETYRNTGVTLEPHGSVAWKGLEKYIKSENGKISENQLCISLETAHPAKFPDEINKVIGFEPEMPASLSALKDKKESYTTLDNDYSLLKRFLLDLYN